MAKFFEGVMANTAQPTATNSNRRVLTASLVGTAVEFYDFYIYATAASLVFGQLFFPSKSASLQQMASFASLGVAFLARPLGAVAFGHFGDRVGRKSTLVASLMLMGGSTLAIAFLPTYAMAGWLAPTLLCLLRFGQGFGLGGEWGGAALLAVENAPPGWRARFGMFPQLGAPVGFIAANGLFLLLGLILTPEQFLAWGWRLPFLGSAALVGVGLWVRLKLTETPAFAAAIAHEAPPAVPLGELLRDHWKATLCGTLAAICCFAVYYLMTAFALGYGVTTLGYSRTAMLSVQLGAILLMAVGIVAAGYWSDASQPAPGADGRLRHDRGGRRPAAGDDGGRLAADDRRCSWPWACWSWASSTARWARSCPTCSRPGCATPAPRPPSMSAASWAAAWPR
jgi:MFS family permease